MMIVRSEKGELSAAAEHAIKRVEMGCVLLSAWILLYFSFVATMLILIARMK